MSLQDGSGPWGNNANEGSIPWQFTLEDGAKITRVVVRSYDIIDAIAFTVVDSNGYITTYEYGNPTSTASEIKLKDGEYITQISGSYGNYKWNNGRVTLSTLKIYTNKNTNGYGPYGKGADVSNTQVFKSSKGKVIGFYGTIGANKHYLESIGITLQDSVQVSKA
ncbi:jacalin-like lectin [Clostridium perfringens]|nr:jacalin-like lectin [Clostridium perfringens]